MFSSGHVDCWGSNGGKLGNGATADSDIPVEAQGITNATGVSTGEEDSCAVLSSGHVECWGSNFLGSLGNSNQGSESDTPVEVHGITNAIQVAVGRQHSCAVLASGQVDCWGAEVIEHIELERFSAVEVQGIHDATEVAADGAHSCALLSSGHVECWEENENGELGVAPSPIEASEEPLEVPGVATATQIAAGSDHSCALLSSGQVSCWGNNKFGQLGNGTTDEWNLPAEVQGVTHATQLAAGGEDSCALMSNSHVDCWGENRWGQLGDGTTVNRDTAVEAQGVTTATQITAGGEAACAMLSGGQVDCWGDNEEDQLGDAMNGGQWDTPVGVHGLTDTTQVAVSYTHSCAVLSGGHVECWGENLSGQLGDGTTERSQAPVEVPGVTNAMQVATGDVDSCAVLSSGHVDCWGADESEDGQLGDGKNESSTTPMEVTDLTNATQVATSTYGSCALLSSGHVDCWGNDAEGQLGDGTISPNASYTPVEVKGLTNATQIAAGEWHFCAVLTSGHVDCWGSAIMGDLGDGTELTADTPVQVHGLTNATEVAAAFEYSCAVLSSGNVDCWGADYNEQLGDGPNTGPERCKEPGGSGGDSCSKTPVEVRGLAGATRVASGGSDSCALLSSGHVDCWGSNLSGQLGNGISAGPDGCEDYACDYWGTPVEVHGLTNATQIAAGASDGFAAPGRACAVLSSGQLDCWGSDRNGGLGDDLAWSTGPVGVAGFSPVAVGRSPAVATGGSSAVSETFASVEGSVNPEAASVSSCVFEYGTSSSYGHSVPCSQTVGAGKTPVAVSAQITGLSPGTLYHYRLLAANDAGSSYGDDETFKTLPEPPLPGAVQSSSVTGAGTMLDTQPSEQASVQRTSATGGGTPSDTSVLSLSATMTKKGALPLAVSCSHGASACTGTISVTLVQHRKHHKSKTVLVGSAHYTVGSASSAMVTLTLSSYARALLVKSRILHTATTVTAHSGATTTKNTIKLTIHA